MWLGCVNQAFVSVHTDFLEYMWTHRPLKTCLEVVWSEELGNSAIGQAAEMLVPAFPIMQLNSIAVYTLPAR